MSVDWETPPQQPEAIRWRRVLGAIGGTLALFAAAVAIEWWMGIGLAEHLDPGRPRVPERLGAPTINLLEQVPFPIQVRGYQRRDDALRALDGYGWVDRARGIVHVPVEQEMARMVEASRRRAGGAR